MWMKKPQWKAHEMTHRSDWKRAVKCTPVHYPAVRQTEDAFHLPTHTHTIVFPNAKMRENFPDNERNKQRLLDLTHMKPAVPGGNLWA